jgi:hypothetical protein
MNFFDEVRLTGGLRWEDNEQFVETFSITGTNREAVRSEVDKTDMLPAVNPYRKNPARNFHWQTYNIPNVYPN